MRVDVGDVAFYVRAEGAGSPLVLLHGGPGLDGSVFFPALAPLADDGVRLLAVDHRANGRSDAGDPARWTVPQMAEDVESLIAELGLERPIVMGHSFGTFVAQQHMAEHGTAAGYVLMGTVDSAEELAAHWRAARGLRAGAPARAGHALLGRGGDGARRSRRPSSCGATSCRSTPRSPRASSCRRCRRSAGEIASARRCCATSPPAARTASSTTATGCAAAGMPVLVLSGELDRTTPAAAAHRLAQLLPDADEVVIPGAAHMLLDEQPEAALAALRAFLARVPA